MSAIFGSPAQASNNGISSSSGSSNSNSVNSSSNQAYQPLLAGLQNQVTNSTGASNALSSLLGVGGDPAAQQSAFQNWQNSTGYQFGLDQGSQAITQNASAQGLLNSGSTAKALDTYGQNYANTQYQNYLNPLQSLVSSGNQAGSVIGSTGQSSLGTSNSQSNSQSGSVTNGTSTGAKQGLAGMLGGIASGVASGGQSISGFLS